jgi:hypothetical protein
VVSIPNGFTSLFLLSDPTPPLTRPSAALHLAVGNRRRT